MPERSADDADISQSMIVTVTPNGSVDSVLRRVGPPSEEEQDVVPVAHTAGGKGHNVARFVAADGRAVTACGFVGGWAGREMEALLRESGVILRLTPIAEPTRRYITCLGERLGRQSLHTPGPTVTAAECRQLVSDVAQVSRGAAVVVLAGSLPPGAPATLFATIIGEVTPTPVVLDTSGDPLSSGVAARPWMVKVNARELDVLRATWGIEAAVTEGPGPTAEDADPGMWRPLLRRLADESGIESVWVTLGPHGAAGWLRGESISVAPPSVQVVNTSGAGDAFLAGLLSARLDGDSVRDAAVRATAMAAALCEQEAPLPPQAARIAALRSEVTVR